MARQFFFAMALMGIGMLSHSPAEASLAAAICENNASNCVGRCANPGGGTNDNKCMRYCDARVTKCLIRVHDIAPRRITR